MSPRSRYLLFGFLLFAAAVCVRLGVWQLSRLHLRQAANAEARARRALPVVDLSAIPVDTGNLADRRVLATGTWDRAHEIVLRGHVYQEAPGVEVVTPLRLTGREDAVLVNRGFVPAPDAVNADLDSLDEPGVVTVRGLALPMPLSQDSGGVLERGGRTTWRRLDLLALRRRTPYRILEVYVVPDTADRRTAGPPDRLYSVPPPALDNGPHLNYAIQWFAFATIAVVGGVIIHHKGTKTQRTPNEPGTPHRSTAVE